MHCVMIVILLVMPQRKNAGMYTDYMFCIYTHYIFCMCTLYTINMYMCMYVYVPT